MLIFKSDKTKNISMMVESTNTGSESLTYTFNITVDNVIYGFPCDVSEGKIKINVPPLEKVIRGLKSGHYRATLDVINNGKFHLQPFNEEVEVKSTPKMDIKVKDDKNVDKLKEALSFTFTSSDMIDEDIEPKEETTKEKEIIKEKEVNKTPKKSDLGTFFEKD